MKSDNAVVNWKDIIHIDFFKWYFKSMYWRESDTPNYIKLECTEPIWSKDEYIYDYFDEFYEDYIYFLNILPNVSDDRYNKKNLLSLWKEHMNSQVIRYNSLIDEATLVINNLE